MADDLKFFLFYVSTLRALPADTWGHAQIITSKLRRKLSRVSDISNRDSYRAHSSEEENCNKRVAVSDTCLKFFVFRIGTSHVLR